MASKLLPQIVNSVGFSRESRVQVGLNHGNAAHEILFDDVGELQQALDTPVQNLLVWSLGSLDELQNGNGQLRGHVVVDFQGDKSVLSGSTVNVIIWFICQEIRCYSDPIIYPVDDWVIISSSGTEP